MRSRGSFFAYTKVIRVEGFEQQKLLSQCLRKKIILRRIRFENNLSMTMEIRNQDWDAFLGIVKRRYRVTILRENGYRPLIFRALKRKSTLVGVLLFLLILIYQASFISEIRVQGYERIEEATIRQALKEVGFYEGCKKNVDINEIKTQMFQKLDNISWIGIKYNGSMAEVTIVEGTKETEPVDASTPVNIVASKDGYIEKVIAREGTVQVQKGASVKKGDVIISGEQLIEDKAYANRSEDELVRYVHANGEVKARILYRFQRYQEKYSLIRKDTGKHFYGFGIQIGTFEFNTAKWFWPYDSSNYEEKNVINSIRPLPVKLSVIKLSEVELYRKKRTDEEIKEYANLQVRRFQKEKIPEKAQIINNSLKFEEKENIIEVTVMLHALEEIGCEAPIVKKEPQTDEQEAEGGMNPIGEPN
ncbi:sporulation protein YqfD [Sinanaerobacter sp. ZZT-01]|uniref:sporulation protein YqfD n=1 Tax=Sinanaerobacter sp. ZZT-01 TaxID=3111540 RepID=UPI002D79CC99|nr:sporulation protein YqfD [Sinanaerobacter sp. ZZT-01]WRR92881.1 sporulation protein YqfD [Sinanaerobacter sp. ZZT-01]